MDHGGSYGIAPASRCRSTEIPPSRWVRSRHVCFHVRVLYSYFGFPVLILSSGPAVCGLIMASVVYLISHTVFGASWAGLLVFDFMILLLTVWKAFSSYRKRGGRLLSTLLCDGERFLSLPGTAVNGVQAPFIFCVLSRFCIPSIALTSAV